MKQKGAESRGCREETTRDERMRIITLREDAGWDWSKIGEIEGHARECGGNVVTPHLDARRYSLSD